MAWGVKYRLEILDYRGYDWTVEIEQDGFAGSVTDLIGGSDPINFSWENGSDDMFDPIQPSTCAITVKSLTDFALADLYSVDDMQFRVSAYQGASLYWQGYIITGEYGEPYEYTPYDVTIKAWCGLDLLRDIKYMQDETTYYTGRVQVSQILFDVLGKINVADFYEYVNLYDVTHYTTTLDSPFVQTTIDADLFRDLYCDEVLYRILSRFNARIIHKDGKFRIYRPVELAELLVYGRWFTAPGTWSATSYSTRQLINRTTSSSDLLQVPGGDLMILRPAKKVTAYQDYGSKQSWIDNWQFSASTYIGDPDFTFDSWTRSGVWGLNNIADLIPGEVDGVCLTPDADPVTDDYIYQSFAPFAVASVNDVIVFSFDYLFYNNDTAGDGAILIIKVQDNSGNYLYEASDSRCDWTASESYITITNASLPLGKTGWDTYERTIVGLLAAGSLTISIYKIQSVAGVYGAVKNIRFHCTSDAIVSKTKKRNFFQRIKFTGSFGNWQISLRNKYYPVRTIKDEEEITETMYSKSNAINGQEMEYDYTLGDVEDANIDNVLEQFAGALGSYDYVGMTHGITSSWSTRTGAEALPIRQLLCDEIASEYSRPKQLIQMPIVDEGTGASAINILGHWQDALNQYGGNNRRFVFNRGSFSARFRKWEIDMVEVMALGGTPGEDPGDPTSPTAFPGQGWGALYNYYAVTNAKNIANTGWHVPSESEISLISAYNEAYGLDWKMSGLDYWQNPNTVSYNSSLVNIRGAGYRNSDGTFSSRKYSGYIATSNLRSPGFWKAYVCNYNNASLGDSASTSLKHGISVRLIKDTTTLSHGETGYYTGNNGKVYPTICIYNKEIVAINLLETKYRDGSDITVLVGNDEWAADTEGAMCYWDNDIVNINSIAAINGAVHDTTISVSINATSPAAISQEIFWQVRNSSDLVRSSGSEIVSIASGTANYTISVDIPNETGTLYYIMIGKSSSPNIESNKFTIT